MVSTPAGAKATSGGKGRWSLPWGVTGRSSTGTIQGSRSHCEVGGAGSRRERRQLTTKRHLTFPSASILLQNSGPNIVRSGLLPPFIQCTLLFHQERIVQ